MSQHVTDGPTDGTIDLLTDGLQELLEWLFATRNTKNKHCIPVWNISDCLVKRQGDLSIRPQPVSCLHDVGVTILVLIINNKVGKFLQMLCWPSDLLDSEREDLPPPEQRS